MQSVLVLQSTAPNPASWQLRCIDSVQHWARAKGYAYRLLGDELFEQVPDWYLEKIRGRMPIGADLGRLQWAQRLLAERYAWVIWFDADTLIFAPDFLDIPLQQRCIFGQEHWVQPKFPGSRRWTVRKNIHNAFAAFPQDCVVLPFLTDLTQRMIERVDAEHIAPQMVGPKLLSSLHGLAAFEHLPAIGALSPDVMKELARVHDVRGALLSLCNALPVPMTAANLCASLLSQLGDGKAAQMEAMHRAIDRLLNCQQGLSELDDLGA